MHAWSSMRTHLKPRFGKNLVFIILNIFHVFFDSVWLCFRLINHVYLFSFLFSQSCYVLLHLIFVYFCVKLIINFHFWYNLFNCDLLCFLICCYVIFNMLSVFFLISAWCMFMFRIRAFLINYLFKHCLSTNRG